MVDHELIRKAVNDLGRRYIIQQIAADPGLGPRAVHVQTQEQLAVQQRVEVRRRVAQVHADHAVLGLADCPAVLPLDAGGLLALFGEAGLIQRTHGKRIAVAGGQANGDLSTVCTAAGSFDSYRGETGIDVVSGNAAATFAGAWSTSDGFMDGADYDTWQGWASWKGLRKPVTASARAALPVVRSYTNQ